jgi:spore germination cell wall hydrolase CwlJ-like protein
MIFRGLVNLIRTIWTELLVELETHPQALRQGAAAAVAVAAVAAVMPAISHRAAEQRADAEWAARAEAFQIALAATEADTATLTKASLDAVSPAARVTLAVAHAEEGLRARVEGAALDDRFQDRHATTVAVALRDQAALVGLSAFQPAALRAASEHARDLNCLAQAIYYEARGESELGQLAVAEVVVNRARSRHFPGKFCDVIYEGSWRSAGCQFTFTCDGSLRNKPRGIAWAQARDIASQVIMGVNHPVTHDATHYHTTEVAPVWSASLVETTRIGAHIFYRFPNRREREAMRAALVAPETVEEVVASGVPPQVGQAVETAAAVVALDHAT